MTDARLEFISKCMEFTWWALGEGIISIDKPHLSPEEIYWEYTQLTDDERWETLHIRIRDDLLSTQLGGVKD